MDRWSKKSVGLWVGWIALFLGLEGIGLYREHDTWPPLTQVVRRYVPKWVALAFLSWLLIHFSETYTHDPN